MTTVATRPDTGAPPIGSHLPIALPIRSRHRPRRYVYLPLRPLDEYLARVRSARELSELANVCSRTVFRWRCAGEIPDLYADRIATALGTHPALVWGMTWWTSVPEVV